MEELTAMRLSPLIGREAELSALAQALNAERLVTVTGPGGVGKTRLAVAALDQRGGEVAAVGLAVLVESEMLPERILTALGGRLEVGVDPRQTLVSRLGSGRLTLLLDNCEHLRAAAAQLCGDLLVGAPHLRVLATSRVPLGVPSEITFEVGPLSAGPDGDSVALFLDRARRSSRSFVLDAETLEHVDTLCEKLDGLPLAIELAAARARVLDVRRILTDLDRRLDIVGGAAEDLPRHRSLRASMEWSCALLTHEERLLFGRLSVFSGGWDLSAAEAVCTAPPIDPSGVLEFLSALVDRSLVAVDRRSEASRFGMLTTVRAYAQERLSAAGDEDQLTRAAHALWCAELVERAEQQLMSREQSEALSLLDREIDNIRAALSWATLADPALGLRIAAATALYWHTRGRLSEGRTTLEALLAGGRVESPELRARALWALGLMLVAVGELRAARPIVEEAVGRARDTGEAGLQARALNLIAELDVMADPQAAKRSLDDAVALARTAGDAWCLASALGRLGAGALYRGDAAEAKVPLAESLEIARAAGDEQATHRALGGLARVAAIEGDADEAVRLLGQSLSLSERLGDRSWIARDLAMMGELQRSAGRPTEGAPYAERGLAIAEEINAGYARALATGVLGRIALAGGELDAAERRFAEALELTDRAGLRPFRSWWLLGLADAALARGDLDAAGVRAVAAFDAASAIDNRLDRSRATGMLGIVALERGEHDVAIAQLTAALATVRDLGAGAGAARALDALVRAFEQSGQTERAERLRAVIARADGNLGEAITMALRGRRLGSGQGASGWGGLTQAEADVAELAAAGASNPEIGERLFMSRSTVKTHLSRVYAKLHVANRTELAGALGTLRERH